jgi:hypothetical protein
MGPRYVYKDMLDNVVNHITCVSMNHQNQLEQMANGAMFATRDTQCPLWLRLANPYVSLTREAEHEELRSMTPWASSQVPFFMEQEGYEPLLVIYLY